MHTADTRVQQHLVDIRSGNRFLIEHRTDIQTFGHRDIIEVLHVGDSLAYTKPFGRQASEDIRFTAVRHGYKSVCVLNTFFFEYIHIATVGIDNQSVRYFLTQYIA